MKEKLKRYEQETIIQYRAEDKWSYICTTEPAVSKKLDKLCEKHPGQYIKIKHSDATATDGVSFYRVQKRLIRFSAPRKLTAKQKEELVSRFHCDAKALK